MNKTNKIKKYLSYKLRNFKYNFLNGTILKQSLLIFVYALLTVSAFVLILFFVNDKPLSDFNFALVALKILFYIDTFDNLSVQGFQLGSVATNQNINLLHTFILVLLVVVWQAILIFKMMQTDESVVLSENITYYPKKTLKDKKIQPSAVVFRLMNDGFNTIYSIKITASLRIKPSNGPYRHYKLTVRDPFIASLEVGMPYQIFINTGEIKNVELETVFIDGGKSGEYAPETAYLENDDCSEVKNIPHPFECESGKIPEEAWIIVLIEAFDDFLDQTNITKKVYDYHQLKQEEFTNIESKVEAMRRIKSYEKIKKDQAELFEKDKFKKMENSVNWYYDDENAEEIIVEEDLTKITAAIKDLKNADKAYNIFDRDEVIKYFDSFGKVDRF